MKNSPMEKMYVIFLLPNRLLHSVYSCLSSSVCPSYLCSLCGGPAVSCNAPLRATCSFKATHSSSPCTCVPALCRVQPRQKGNLSGALPARVKPSYHIDHTEQSTPPDTFVLVVRDVDRCPSTAQTTSVWLTLTCALLRNDDKSVESSFEFG